VRNPYPSDPVTIESRPVHRPFLSWHAASMAALLVFAIAAAPSAPDSAEVTSSAPQTPDVGSEVVPKVANGVVSLDTMDFDVSHLAPSSFGDWDDAKRE